jgi:hypothetical protein
MLAKNELNDIFRRFTPTPLVADLNVMGRSLRLETNSPVVLECTSRAFERYKSLPSSPNEFRWRLISDPSSGLRPPWPKRFGFSDEGVRFINFDQRAFLAVDLATREAVGFLSEELANDEMGFCSPYLSDLFDMTAAALGLTEITAGCVVLKDQALLVFGQPRSGKTTSGYLAGRLGMELHADQVTCLEFVAGTLRAWGQFWPPAFRTETLQFLPELLAITRPVSCCDFTLLCLQDSPVRPAKARSVVPSACVFLERSAAESPQLALLSEAELTPLLAQSLPFREDSAFDFQRAEILSALARLPAYRLAYPADPQIAAALFPELLRNLQTTESKL